MMTTGSATSRTAPNTEVSHGPRSGLRQARGPTQARRRVAFESAPQPRGEAVGGILDLAAGLVTASHRQFLLPSDLLYMIEPPALNRDHPVGAPGRQGHDGERRVGRVGDQRRGLRVDLAAVLAVAAVAAVLAVAAAAAVLAVAAAAAVLAVAEPALVMATGPTRTAMPGRRPRRNTSPLPLTGVRVVRVAVRVAPTAGADRQPAAPARWRRSSAGDPRSRSVSPHRRRPGVGRVAEVVHHRSANATPGVAGTPGAPEGHRCGSSGWTVTSCPLRGAERRGGIWTSDNNSNRDLRGTALLVVAVASRSSRPGVPAPSAS